MGVLDYPFCVGTSYSSKWFGKFFTTYSTRLRTNYLYPVIKTKLNDKEKQNIYEGRDH